MTASAYLVNFRINVGDLAEVALIWPDMLVPWRVHQLVSNTHMTSIFLKSSQNDFSLPGLLNWSHADSTQKNLLIQQRYQNAYTCLYIDY